MEENVQELLKDKDEDVVQFNFENNTSSPVVIDLFDTSSLTTIPTSGTSTTTYSTSNDLLPNVDAGFFSLNPNNGTFIASDINKPIITIIDTTTNTTENNFDNSLGFDGNVIGRFTTVNGKTFTITDIKTRNRTYPIIAEFEGKSYKLSVPQVKRGLLNLTK